MLVIIAGSRFVTSYHLVCVAMVKAAEKGTFKYPSVIFSGGARGADTLGERWAKDNGIPVESFIPDWRGKGKSAGFLRNIAMAQEADALVAIWDGESRGTKHMIDTMRKMGKPVFVHNF